MADCEAPSDLLRVTQAGFVVPSHIRPGFSRTWGISVVSDMWAPYDEAISDIHASIITKPPCSWSSSDITCEVLDGQRLRLEVALDAPTTPALTFELVLEAKVHCGRVVLPLHLGPVAVVASLPRPNRAAASARVLPLRMVTAPLRIHEAQDCNSTIASSTWDPGVLLAAYLSSKAASTQDLLGAAATMVQTLDEPLRVVEVGCGCGVAGLALAAARPQTRAVLTDGDAAACALAAQNVKDNGLAGRVDASTLRWKEGGNDRKELAALRACLGGPPQLVLAADVVYLPSSFEALVGTLASLCDMGVRGSHADSGNAADVLFAYRPRIEGDAHFFHLLLEEFDATLVVPASEAGALLRAAFGAHQASDTAVDNQEEGGSGEGERQIVAGGLTGQGCDGMPYMRASASPSSSSSTGAPCMIYRLRRREERVPTQCRTCQLRKIAHKAATAASIYGGGMQRDVVASAG